MTETEIKRQQLPSPRYEYGGDDYVFVELDEAMSFDANFKAQAITQEIRNRDLSGIIEVAPANASYLIQFDPNELAPDALVEELGQIRRSWHEARQGLKGSNGCLRNFGDSA